MIAMRIGRQRLDTSTQGEYTKSKSAFENVKEFQWFEEIIANPATLANSSQKVMVIKYQRGATLFNCRC